MRPSACVAEKFALPQPRPGFHRAKNSPSSGQRAQVFGVGATGLVADHSFWRSVLP
jgi:hypothetical protein